MRCPWQQEDHVKLNSRYASHRMHKKIVKEIHLTLLFLYYKIVLWEFFDILCIFFHNYKLIPQLMIEY